MRIAVIGGGPGGLYFSTLVKQLRPDTEITVWERNAPDDTFGFGVVFSDQTLSGIKASDRPAFDAMGEMFAYWDDIDIWVDGEIETFSGNGFAAMSRVELLAVLQKRAIDAGVDVRFLTEAPPEEELMAQYDLVVACDGINSPIREKYAKEFGASVDWRKCKYIWLGTDTVFDAFKFFVKNTEWGVMQVHAYPMNASKSTYIVEMDENVWRKAGFDKVDAASLPPGVSDTESIERLTEIFADTLEGGSFLANNSKWLTFRTIRNDTLVYKNMALLGDAAHTAHYSIGSGTKLAMEDALALAGCVIEEPTVEAALAKYDKERGPVIKSTQRSAQASMEWFEDIARYAPQDLTQFAFNMMTRSRRVTYGNLQERDPKAVAKLDQWFNQHEIKVGNVPAGTSVRPPMFYPLVLRGVTLPNRIVISPIGLYSAVDGVPGDFHSVHYGARLLGGAGLVMTEMVAVSPEGRISLGDAGLWNDEQAAAWKRIVEFAHNSTSSKIGIQLGHAGGKGASNPPWKGVYSPLASGGWATMAASPVAYNDSLPAPREMSVDDMQAVAADFVNAAKRAAEIGFDVLELLAGHGFLLASFLSPALNQRTDEFGGSVENRLRFPLQVVRAVRDAWPADRPLSVRISAADWVANGISPEDSVVIAKALADAGADLIDVSTGETLAAGRPAYGRSYQTPYADRIRNEAHVTTMAVGAISSWDDANTIIAAGRADLVGIGRPSLYDPSWTLHAAAEQGYDMEWHEAYVVGSTTPPTGRGDDYLKPRLELTPAEAVVDRPSRWQP